MLKDKKVGFYDNIYLVYYTKYFACQQANCYSSLIRTTKYCPNWLDIFDTFCLLHHLNKNIDNMELSQWLYFFKCFSFLLPLRRSAKKIKIKNVEVGLILKEHGGNCAKNTASWKLVCFLFCLRKVLLRPVKGLNCQEQHNSRECGGQCGQKYEKVGGASLNKSPLLPNGLHVW